MGSLVKTAFLATSGTMMATAEGPVTEMSIQSFQTQPAEVLRLTVMILTVSSATATSPKLATHARLALCFQKISPASRRSTIFQVSSSKQRDPVSHTNASLGAKPVSATPITSAQSVETTRDIWFNQLQLRGWETVQQLVLLDSF